MRAACHQYQVGINGLDQIRQRPSVAPLHGVVALDADDIGLCRLDDGAHLLIAQAVAQQVSLIDLHQGGFLFPASEGGVDDLNVITRAPGHCSDAQQADGSTCTLHHFKGIDADLGECAVLRCRFDQARVGRNE